METQMADMARTESARGVKALLRRFFAWKHLVLVGATACLALSLLCYLYISASRLLVACVLFPLSLLLFAFMLFKEKLLRWPDMKLLLAAFLWLSAVCVMNVGRAGAANFPYYANACAVALLCYPLAYVVRRERRQRTFDLLAGLWITPVACSSVLGVALALSGATLVRQSDGAVAGMVKGRLALICDSNMYGILCCLAICLILYLLLEKRRPLVRALLILAALSLFWALTLTDNRTSQLSLLLAAFFFAAILVCRIARNKSRLIRLLTAALAGMAFCVALWFGYQAVRAGTNRLASELAAASEPASGGETGTAVPETAIKRRGANTETLQLRLGIWTYALERLGEEKDVLLRGASPALTGELFLDTSGHYVYNHFHNAYIGVLLAYGLPGVLLMLAFFAGLAVCACRLLFSKRRDLPDALRFLPVILLPVLAINCMEEMLFTRSFVSELDVWLALAGGYTVTLSREWRRPEPLEAPLPNG